MYKHSYGVRTIPTYKYRKDYRFFPDIDDERIGDDNPIGGDPANWGLSGPDTGLEVSDIRGSDERIVQSVMNELFFDVKAKKAAQKPIRIRSTKSIGNGAEMRETLDEGSLVLNKVPPRDSIRGVYE